MHLDLPLFSTFDIARVWLHPRNWNIRIPLTVYLHFRKSIDNPRKRSPVCSRTLQKWIEAPRSHRDQPQERKTQDEKYCPLCIRQRRKPRESASCLHCRLNDRRYVRPQVLLVLSYNLAVYVNKPLHCAHKVRFSFCLPVFTHLPIQHTNEGRHAQPVCISLLKRTNMSFTQPQTVCLLADAHHAMLSRAARNFRQRSTASLVPWA